LYFIIPILRCKPEKNLNKSFVILCTALRISPF
jgi:hypothetical protein